MEEVQEKPDTNFQVSSLRKLLQIGLVLPTMCVNTCEIFSIREAHLSLGVQGFNWWSVLWSLSYHFLLVRHTVLFQTSAQI